MLTTAHPTVSWCFFLVVLKTHLRDWVSEKYLHLTLISSELGANNLTNKNQLLLKTRKKNDFKTCKTNSYSMVYCMRKNIEIDFINKKRKCFKF